MFRYTYSTQLLFELHHIGGGRTHTIRSLFIMFFLSKAGEVLCTKFIRFSPENAETNELYCICIANSKIAVAHCSEVVTFPYKDCLQWNGYV